MDGRKNNGGKRENAGRPPKAVEQKIVDRVSLLEDKAFKSLEQGLKDNEAWATKLWFEYVLGKPKQQIDHTTNGNDVYPPISWS